MEIMARPKTTKVPSSGKCADHGANNRLGGNHVDAADQVFSGVTMTGVTMTVAPYRLSATTETTKTTKVPPSVVYVVFVVPCSVATTGGTPAERGYRPDQTALTRC